VQRFHEFSYKPSNRFISDHFFQLPTQYCMFVKVGIVGSNSKETFI